jgi:hypothetical protein
MATEDTEFIFPPKIIPELRDLRGPQWCELVDRISSQPSDGLERVAFILMMVRLGGCTTCQADSFKAMRGCGLCASQTVKRFRGEDKDLLNLLETAKRDVKNYNSKQTKIIING